jgi:peptide/nickel transport system ATP-binding protein
MAPAKTLFANPSHPYTQALLSAVPEPSLDNRLNLHDLMEGRASDPAQWPAPFTIDNQSQPRLVELGDGHYVRADPARGALPEVA